MNVLMYTLGCKLNQCESEAIADAFKHEGFSVVTDYELADLCVVNTCTVTSKAEQKARRMIRKYASGKAQPVVLVTGCYAQMEAQALEQLDPRVVVVSLDDKPALLNLPKYLVERHLAGFALLDAVRSFVDEPSPSSSSFSYDAATFSFHSRAFLKIQDGCDNACAYCRVTIARGDARSLDADEVIRRSVALEDQGFTELVLTGVNISAYQSNSLGLGGLLLRLLDELGPHMRIRLSSLEPDTIDEQLIQAISDPRVQPHFHIPVQSASELVLNRVNRLYPMQQVRTVIERLRQVKSDPFIAADIITGLPAETDEAFGETVRFIKEMDLSQLHVFPFSPRPQTALYTASDRVPESLRDVRAKELRELSAIQFHRYMSRQVGTVVEMIVEQKSDGTCSGLTGNYLKIAVSDVPESVQRGSLIRIALNYDKQSGHLSGRYVSVIHH
jgi:threonylcarbamoyladenosine tRNA methylthiotransferase MtaB